MRLSLIWAMTRNHVIGRDNSLPWTLPDEMRHFVRTTRGKPVIMGRKQWESMPRALPHRTNIVLTRQRGYRAENAIVVTDFDQALDVARDAARRTGADEIMVIGGAEIYALALPRADRLYQTVIEAELDGDTFFPQFDIREWQRISSEAHAADDRHAYAYHIDVLERARPEGP
jgi:dihydrofolate reductase